MSYWASRWALDGDRSLTTHMLFPECIPFFFCVWERWDCCSQSDPCVFRLGRENWHGVLCFFFSVQVVDPLGLQYNQLKVSFFFLNGLGAFSWFSLRIFLRKSRVKQVSGKRVRILSESPAPLPLFSSCIIAAVHGVGGLAAEIYKPRVCFQWLPYLFPQYILLSLEFVVKCACRVSGTVILLTFCLACTSALCLFLLFLVKRIVFTPFDLFSITREKYSNLLFGLPAFLELSVEECHKAQH